MGVGVSPHLRVSAGTIPVGNAIDVWRMCLRVTCSPPICAKEQRQTTISASHIWDSHMFDSHMFDSHMCDSHMFDSHMFDNKNTHHCLCREDLVQLLLHIFKLLKVIKLSRL
jgi:hypothetical protein